MVQSLQPSVFMRVKGMGTTAAVLLSTAAVFFATWILHAYQSFWMRADARVPMFEDWGLFTVDALFWGKRADTDARTLASAVFDAASVSSWAVGSMNWALKNKYLTGMNGLFAPKVGTIRAQAAAILARYLAA